MAEGLEDSTWLLPSNSHPLSRADLDALKADWAADKIVQEKTGAPNSAPLRLNAVQASVLTIYTDCPGHSGMFGRLSTLQVSSLLTQR